ncbi:hypothetical protein ACWDOR_37180 [Streptosporangium canum]
MEQQFGERLAPMKASLSPNHRDKARVRALAVQLRLVGADVWLDEWEIRPGIAPASNSHSHDTSAGSAPPAATIVALAPESPSSVQFSVVTGTCMLRHPQRSKSATSLRASSGRSPHCSVPRRAAATERLTF